MSGLRSSGPCVFRLSESVKRKFCGAAVARCGMQSTKMPATANNADEKKRRAKARRLLRADPEIGKLLLRDRTTEHPVDLLVGGIAARLRSLGGGQDRKSTRLN